ncbi:MAG: division/cell wall cluster transcriptional repressor MraZ [Clostridiales bacterium]|nr:division/cell wall cluster transcriptional repressor MraZ [Clostridiales bacterium]MCD7827196.1 division/cell wall cluster transcriptional repressor MraZ [Clostridiales bacterium]
MSYSGVYYHNLDAKNRIFIPAKFRESLGETFYLFKSTEKCLYIYDEENWQHTIDTIINESATEEGRNRQRKIFKRVASVEMDKQGRITINADFVSHALLTKDVVIAGMGRRIEIWDLDEWNKIDDDDVSDIRNGIVY